MIRTRVLLLFAVFSLSLQGQDGQFTSTLYETYDTYREPDLGKRRIKHQDLQPLIDAIGAHPGFEVRTVGRSIEGRALRLISIGAGDTDVFLWSQMHGNEPTATQAIFDILNFLASPDLGAEKKEILQSVRLHFLPMLNPDGAEVFSRYNTLGIDINRDALRLQSPEGRTLKRVRDSLQAERMKRYVAELAAIIGGTAAQDASSRTSGVRSGRSRTPQPPAVPATKGKQKSSALAQAREVKPEEVIPFEDDFKEF